MSAAGVLAVMDAYPDLLDFAACHYEAHFKGPGNGGYVPSPHVVAGLAKAAEARAAVAELLEALSDFEGMAEPSMPGTPAKIRRLRGAYARCKCGAK